MELSKNKIVLRKKIFLLIFSIFIFQLFKLPYNFYYIKNSDYNSRMIISHGYCDKESYGFITETIRQFDLTDSFPIREIYYPTPGLEGLVKKIRSNYDEKYLFVLNYAQNENQNLEHFNQKRFRINNLDIDLSNYSLKKRSGNCFFWIKNE